MKFGPSPFNYNFVIDIIAAKGLEALATFSISKYVHDAATLGYNHFEIGLDIFQTFPIPILREELEKLHQIKKELNISYSCHFPFLSLDFSGPNQFIREGSISAIIDIYNLLKDIESDIDCFVLHPTGETTTEILHYISDLEIKLFAVEMFKQNAIHSVNTFIAKTGINLRKLAIENLDFPLKPTLEIIKETQTRFCLDTAHLLGDSAENLDVCEVLRDNYDLISEIHLQEYNTNSQDSMSDHAALGTTCKITAEFFEVLNSRKFQGPLIFELEDHEIRESCEYIRKIYPAHQGLPHF
ncbi:MAG: sugar phosphate isomerase/epimerase [Promethearchaeota archaeon]|nr:MAG: sugar phosphate isomerase/epimerase [Candidatus Lokiarchaeota archaeon]